MTVPTFRMYDPKGEWFAEGHGVEPDIAVEEDPAQLAKGIDPQLERAIQGSDEADRGAAEGAGASRVRETHASQFAVSVS